ncbi:MULTISPECIES: hypothetical protein [unclassified Fusibacter]|uniref:hypothetical protein n=1 Tax=unclassified Fusibacter TaxID=2624464 RepID=UPI0010133A86|nr:MULTISPECIES: hypothetical protein [unclassified Fusibacter]MCK8058935.1 hypothetical protein [Fusibacter sp. A2]NPE22011.1 hypothetical protein [Fusibacter sp. A1]RXV61576.1 hypothetical protein DWB64_09210 [Fusibacter sp. A1]
MDMTSMILIGVVTSLMIGGAVAVHFYKKKNIAKLFEQVYESSKQVPKQKKNSFLLLMFKEAMTPPAKPVKSKDKSKGKGKGKSKAKPATTPNQSKFNNPKYVEIQLMQMAKVLKDNSIAKDKPMKQSLRLLKDYLAWEAEKNSQSKSA